MDKRPTYSEAELQTLELEYKTVVLTADPFCKELVHQIERLLDEEDVALGFPIQRRVKPWSSVSEKLERVGFRVASR